jgi:DNA invertase Pin-like site-specific DNA recombinase
MTRKPKKESPDTATTLKIGYARVSTAEQDLDTQVRALEAFGCDKIYKESISGASTARPQFALLKKDLRAGDTLVVHSISRIGRSLRNLLEFNEWLLSEGIALKSLTEPIDTSTANGKLVFQLQGVFAEYERNLTIERTRAWQAKMKAEGHVFGAPRKVKEKTLLAIKADLEKTTLSIPAIAKKHGKAPSTVNYYFPGWRSKTAKERAEYMRTHPIVRTKSTAKTKSK